MRQTAGRTHIQWIIGRVGGLGYEDDVGILSRTVFEDFARHLVVFVGNVGLVCKEHYLRVVNKSVVSD